MFLQVNPQNFKPVCVNEAEMALRMMLADRHRCLDVPYIREANDRAAIYVDKVWRKIHPNGWDGIDKNTKLTLLNHDAGFQTRWDMLDRLDQAPTPQQSVMRGQTAMMLEELRGTTPQPVEASKEATPARQPSVQPATVPRIPPTLIDEESEEATTTDGSEVEEISRHSSRQPSVVANLEMWNPHPPVGGQAARDVEATVKELEQRRRDAQRLQARLEQDLRVAKRLLKEAELAEAEREAREEEARILELKRELSMREANVKNLRKRSRN